jgi:hypothetical protein
MLAFPTFLFYPMSSFTAELRVAGQRYPVVQFHLAFTQATDQRGRVTAKVRHGQLELELDVPDQDHLLTWAAEAHKALPGTLVIFDAVGHPQEYVSFTTAYCVTYHEVFQAGDTQRGAYRCTLHLTDPAGFTIGAAAPGDFTAPPARAHSQPPPSLASTPIAIPPGGPVSSCPPAETARLQAQVELLCKTGKSKCIDTDTCPKLTAKMAALQACITARETIMNRCFGGGDAGHQNEVQQRKNGLRRCAAIYQRQCTPRLSPSPAPVPRRVPSTDPVPESPSPVVPATVVGAAALILYILSSALRPGPI